MEEFKDRYLEKDYEFIQKVNIEKANKRVLYAFPCIILSLLSYVLPLMYGSFDFGVVIEICSLLCLIFAKINMKKETIQPAKIWLILSQMCIVMLLLYDCVIACQFIQFDSIFSFVYSALYEIAYVFIYQLELVVFLILLTSSYFDLRKAESPDEFERRDDFFYERKED